MDLGVGPLSAPVSPYCPVGNLNKCQGTESSHFKGFFVSIESVPFHHRKHPIFTMYENIEE